MRTTIFLTGLAFAAASLAFLPAATAMQVPPPCSTTTACCGIEPDFAPCCSVLSCPPTVARCPDLDVDTSGVGPFRAPWADVETDSDCSANACVNSSDCSDAACQAGEHFCCSLQGTLSFCTTLGSADVCAPPPAGAAAAQTALPVPHVSVVQNDDCSFTVSETVDSCPNGFVESTIRYTVYAVYPVHFELDQCVPQCACIPLAVHLAAPEDLA
jgi:hypothetical protein